MDIRKFFGPGSTNNRSALSEVRESHGSPTMPAKKKQRKLPKKPTSSFVSSSDEENPLPRSLQEEAKKRSKKRKIAISSDDDDFPPSASQDRSEKRNEKIINVSSGKKAKDEEVDVITSLTQTRKRPPKNVKESSPVMSDQSSESHFTASEEDYSDFVPAKKSKPGKCLPGQTKLYLERKENPLNIKSKSVGQKILKKVDPTDFFKGFNTPKKCTVEAKKEKAIKSKDRKEIVETFNKTNNETEDSSIAPMARRKFSPKCETRKESVRSSKISSVTNKATLSEKPIKATSNPETLKQSHVKTKKTEDTIAEVPVPAASFPSENLPWVDKYKPTSLKHIVGQNGEKSPLKKLMGWLEDWPKYHLGEGAKQKKHRPPPWMAQSDGSSFKAALLSGPPGIGKTTCALLACKELFLQHIEMNASDARNKKLLDVKVAELLGSRQIIQFFGKSADLKKAKEGNKLTHVLIMDEVDGMSGNEDRAGLAELIQMIKRTKIPIICICNDRQSPKMRTLVNYCFDLRFSRPRVEQIRPRIQSIAYQEKLKLAKEEVDELIEASNHDVRQTIYNLQLLSHGAGKDIQKKDVAMNLFEAARMLLNAETGIAEKQRMFFIDYSIMPLFVQENYLSLVSSKMSKKEFLRAIQKSADVISSGDLVDKICRSTGSWSLLNEQALFSSVIPSMYMDGYLRSMINFPAWLGKNSSMNKHHRLLRQLEAHTFHKISSNSCSLVTEYVPLLRDALSLPLIRKENEGVQDVISVLDEYDLTREDSDEIAELGTWPDMQDYRKGVLTKVKSALTRAYNKHSHLLPYATEETSKKRGHLMADPEFKVDEEGNVVEDSRGDEQLDEDDKSESESEVPIFKAKPGSQKSEISRGRGGGRGGTRSSRGTGGKRDSAKGIRKGR